MLLKILIQKALITLNIQKILDLVYNDYYTLNIQSP